MWLTNRWLCVFDIKNKQSEYSHIAEIIRDLEQLSGSMTLSFQAVADISGLRITRAPNVSTEAEQVAELEARLARGNPALFRTITSWEMLMSGLTREPEVRGFSYYIRINIDGDGSDLPDLRYLALLIQSTPRVCDKLAVFFWGHEITGKKSFEHYTRLSQFLRPIQIKYDVFYAVYGNNIQKLTVKPDIPKDFLPLLEIDSDTCPMLRQLWNLSVSYYDRPFDKLFTSIYPDDAQDHEVTMLFQIGARMFFRALDGRKYGTSSKKQHLLESLSSVVKTSGGISALDMILFGALMDRNLYDNLGPSELSEYLECVRSLSMALAQILENIVYHSEHGKGVFTIRIQTKYDYIQENYPNYQIGEQEYGLELLIADSNHQDGIVQNFLTGSKVTPTLKGFANKITLADFFQKKPQSPAAEAWAMARARDPEFCHGLLAFANTAEQFNGAVKVRSSPTASGTDRESYFYYDYDRKEISSLATDPRWIPGTQFSIIFKRKAFRQDIRKKTMKSTESIFHEAHVIYGTTYGGLAWALEYGSCIEPLFPVGLDAAKLTEQMKADSPHVGWQEQKDIAVQNWKHWFSERAAYGREKAAGKSNLVLFDADMAGFSGQSVQDWEVFCKGFLSSDFFIKPDSDIRYGILLRNMSAALGRAFYQTLCILAEHIYTESTCVYFYQENEKGGAARYIGATLHESLRRIGIEKTEIPEGLPVVLPYPLLVKEGDGTLFEHELTRQAKISILSSDEQGYQVEDTHMRLGNKVHIDSFFEMSLFFESPNYAYYTAFLLLERLKSAGLGKFRRVLLYGYTSYSRGIVWAAERIWKKYFGNRPGQTSGDEVEIEFVIYQNDLKLESASPSVQMYYSKKEWLKDPKTIWPAEETALVQIVPISSSLNTFNKMLSKLNSETGRDRAGQQFKPMANLTAFWVRDDFERKWFEAHRPGEPDATLPTDEEKYFWDHVDLKSKMVIRGPKHDASEVPVQYLVSVTSYWRNPLSCEKCFPRDLLLEYPLVETDPTSTVPTQQFYPKAPRNAKRTVGANKRQENDCRISKLRGNIFYGHISRGHNHFQYYIQTRQYFQDERDEISKWLEEISKVKQNGGINVLVVPKQTSNVEFSQYVYEYYFKGDAESIIVNTEKEFRSNFLVEYNGLRQRLMKEKHSGRQVHFHYVDMAISSGTTFNRAAALIRSLFAHEHTGKENAQRRDAFPFENVFLLISRMSEDSKRTYVEDPDTQFHAYAELNISNIRTYGDSCVPCKLQQEACLHYHNAATKSVSEYWQKKSALRASISFDQYRQMKQAEKDEDHEGYLRMVCTHRATSYIMQARGKETSDYFNALRWFFTELLDAVENKEMVSPVFQNAPEERLGWLSAGLKVVVRPFFSFDYKLRCAAMDLYLLLANRLLDPNGRQPNAEMLAENGKGHLNQEVLDWVQGFADTLSRILNQELADSAAGEMSYPYLRFIQSHLLKGLTDLKSNYILRRDTMLLLCRCLSKANADESEQNKFFSHYLRSILRLMHTSSDETKSVWLEHLLQFQEEHDPGIDVSAMGHDDSMKKQILKDCPEIYPAFQHFFDLLLVENNRPLYQGVQDTVRDPADNQLDHSKVKEVLEEYYMHNVCHFVSLGATKETAADSKGVENELVALRELYLLLHPVKGVLLPNQSTKDPLARYDRLCKALNGIVLGRDAETQERQVLLFGRHKYMKDQERQAQNHGDAKGMPPYYMISPRLAIDYSGQTEHDVILNKLAERLRASGSEDELEKTGYLLLRHTEDQELSENKGEEELYDAILALDNNFDAISEINRGDYSIQKIEPVYIFLPCRAKRMKALMAVRNVLMFRRKLIAWLEQDFNNHAIADLSRQRYWAETLAADKVGDHAERGFIECMQRVLTDEGEWDGQDCEIAGKDGRPTVELKAKRHRTLTSEHDPEHLERARRWYLLCAYVNSRISRLYRTYAREANHREFTGDLDDSSEQMKKLYARDHQDIGMRPAYDLGTVFFTQIDAGKRRKDYIAQMIRVITFCIDGWNDTAHGDSERDRLAVIEEGLRGYQCIQFDKDNDHYAYLSEYLAAILLDCCISALKAGKDWNDTRWGDLAYSTLCEKAAADKCRVILYRESGPAHFTPAFDYLVIENEVYAKRDKQTKQGPGMSQKAIRWYIDKLWQFISKEEDFCPEVKFSPLDKPGEPYRIKLPILKRKEGQEI